MNCDAQTIGLFGTVIGIIGAIFAVIFGVRAWMKDKKHDERSDGQALGTVQSDLAYIKGGIDDLKKDLREVRTNQTSFAERLSKAEEQIRHLFKRIEDLKNGN